MTSPAAVRARVSMWIDCPPERVFDAFAQPDALTKFWLSAANAALEIGQPVLWCFAVAGAEIRTIATRLDRPRALAWDWADESRVSIDLEPVDGGTAVTVVNDGFGGDAVAAALNATEGFALVLADLKTWIETGASARIVRGKAKLIALRQ